MAILTTSKIEVGKRPPNRAVTRSVIGFQTFLGFSGAKQATLQKMNSYCITAIPIGPDEACGGGHGKDTMTASATIQTLRQQNAAMRRRLSVVADLAGMWGSDFDAISDEGASHD